MIAADELVAICSRAAGGDQSAIDTRIAAVTKFKSSVKREAVNLSDTPQYYEALLSAYDFRDATLKHVSLSAICYLSRRVLILEESALTDQLVLVLPLFIENFVSDSESVSKLAIRTFEDVWLAFPAETEQALREHGLTHSNAAIRVVALGLLSDYISKTPKFPFRKFTPVVTRMLNDSDTQVAQSARDLIVQFFSTAVPRAKEDLKREMSRQKIDLSVTADILAAIGDKQPSRPASRQASSSSQAPLTPGSPVSTITAVKALPDFAVEDLEAEDVLSVDSFRREIECMADQSFAGKESETNWRAREVSLQKLRKLLRGNMLEHPGDVVWAIKRLQEGIVKGITSLRTTLAAQACFLVKDAMQIYETYMDPAIEPFLTSLVKLCAGSKKISAAHANVTICAMILSTSYSQKYVSHSCAVMGDRVAAARALAITWLDLLLSRHRNHLIAVWQSQNVDALAEDCLQRGLTDSAPAVRAASRPAYWAFADCFPDPAGRLIAKLDSVQKKMLLAVQGARSLPDQGRQEGHEKSEPETKQDSTTKPEIFQSHELEDTAQESTSRPTSAPVSKTSHETQLFDPARRSASAGTVRDQSDHAESSAKSEDVSNRTERVSARLSERISECVNERETSGGHNIVTVPPDSTMDKTTELESAKFIQHGAELLKQRVQEDPEAKKTVEEISKLVEATVREAKTKKKSPEANAENKATETGASPDEAQLADEGDEPATGAIDEAVDEVRDKLDCDPEELRSKLSSLSEMLSSEDVTTLNKGVHCLSYVLRGKSVPEELAKDLVSIDLPDPDLIGRALSLIFDKVGDEMDPEIKETVSKFVSPDLVAVSLEYIGHAAVIWAAVNFLPAEAVLVVFEVIKPLMDIGVLCEAIFDIVTADSPAETATLVCGQLLLRLDKVPLNDVLRSQVQQVLSLVYRFGDLAQDISDFIGAWLDDSDDEKHNGSDSDSDEETRAKRQSHKDEREALANISGSLITATPQPSHIPDISVYSDPIITSHHVSVSYVPMTDMNMAKPKLNLNKLAPTRSPRRRSDWGLSGEAEKKAGIPDSEEARAQMLGELVEKLQSGSVSKRDFLQLSALCNDLAPMPRNVIERLERAILSYLEDAEHSESEIMAALHIIRRLLLQSHFSTSTEHTLVLQTLTALCARDLSAKMHFAALPETRDALFAVDDLDVSGTILTLVDLYNNPISVSESRRPRVFVLQSLRRLMPKAEIVPEPVGEIVHTALADDDVYIRKEAYPVLLQIHQKSETASGLLKARMSQGQRRLFEYYARA